MEQRRNSDVLTETIDLKDKKVIDIGCGDGALVRMMARHGARVIGIEPNPDLLAQARLSEPKSGETYSQGVAESLPLDDHSVDVVIFFNSLHHVPVEHQGKALEETARVLKTGGIAYICEPLATGPHFEMMQPVHDETRVRAHALSAIRAAGSGGLKEVREITYIHKAVHQDFEAFGVRLTGINPHRKHLFDTNKAELKATFERIGVRQKDGWSFEQPMRVNVLVKQD